MKTKLRAIRRLATAKTRTLALMTKPMDAALRPIKTRENTKMKNLAGSVARPEGNMEVEVVNKK